MATLVADLDALMRRLGAPKVDLLGFSFGAELALEYALTHPERLGRLVLQSPSGGDYVRMAETETYGFAALARDGDDRERLERLAREPIISPAARIAAIWRGADAAVADRFQYRRAKAAVEARRLDKASGFQNTGLMNAVMFSDARLSHTPLMRRAAGFAVPTLVLVGAYDRTTGVDVARDLAVTLGDARLVVFGESRWGGWLPLPASEGQSGRCHANLSIGSHPPWRLPPLASTWPRTSSRFTRSAAPVRSLSAGR
jgi:proline iminopeptidase